MFIVSENKIVEKTRAMKNEGIQFNGLLAHHVDKGHFFDIEVKTLDNAESFKISLADDKLNEFPRANIGLHLLVQLQQNIVTATSRIKNNRNPDVVSKGKDSNKLKSCKGLTITIRITDDRFYVTINDKSRIQMYHRHPVSTLTAIQIDGDIESVKRLDHVTHLPDIWPPLRYKNCGVDFSNALPVQLKPDHLIVIKGQCYGSPKGNFVIRMADVNSGEDIFVFHVSFQDYQVTRYAGSGPLQLQSGDAYGGFPFEIDNPFCIGIACAEEALKIAVDGFIFCSFKFSQPLASFSGICVNGDSGVEVKITEIDHLWKDGLSSNFEHLTRG